ncbi:hypothetical protein FNV43_RR23795 [Rhamnella rubrinervis]|uniref:Uncharacterized protein n=1 Tax=Rhamnella rubrinervis TaxID=2594499 RepID=A0A8K0DR76_9ROSA|nr:hypothetical protein FNV43_RR23795 [Rhamnella rubrinervis]
MEVWLPFCQLNSAKMSSKLAKLGLAVVLAYGLFDGVTYTTFFIMAFLGYEKSTGKNPAANLQALLGMAHSHVPVPAAHTLQQYPNPKHLHHHHLCTTSFLFHFLYPPSKPPAPTSVEFKWHARPSGSVRLE